MKKSLVLAMAMALGVTASAYAANPFSDVPAGHWAYDSINKLAAEFADELDNLGVRVANLEKKADNVKVTGEMRYRYTDSSNDGNTNNDLRSRLWVNGQINDDWSYTGMLENTQDLTDNAGNEDTSFQRAYVEGKLGGLNVTAGRYNAFFANGNVYDTRADGVEVSYGSKIQLKGFAGKGTDATWTDDKNEDHDTSFGNYAGVELTGDFNKLGLTAGYVNFKDMYKEAAGEGLDNAIWYVGGSYDFDGNVAVSGMYLKGDMSKDDKDVTGIGSDGWTAGLTYKGAEASEAGSWGLFANYYDQGGMTYVAHTTDATVFDGVADKNEGFKGWGVGTNYTFAKNIVGTVAYYDTVSKLHDEDHDNIVWADVTFTF